MCSPHFDCMLAYIALKCSDRCRVTDFDDYAVETLRRLPLFQAVQVVQRSHEDNFAEMRRCWGVI